MAKDMVSSLIPLALVGGGAYLLYNYFWGDSAVTAAPVGAAPYAGGPVQTGNGSTQGPQAGSGVQHSEPQMSAAGALIGIKQQLAVKAGGQSYNPWQWAYLIEQDLKVIPAGYLDPYVIDPALQGIPVSQVEQTAYTLDEWWGLAAPVIAQHINTGGNSGVRGLGNTGRVITTGEVAAAASGYYGIPGLAGMNLVDYAGSTGMPASVSRNGMGNLERARAIETQIRPVRGW